MGHHERRWLRPLALSQRAMPSSWSSSKRRWQRDSEAYDPDPDKNKEACWETWEWSFEADAPIRYRVFADGQVQKALHVDWSKVNTKGRDAHGVEVTPKHLISNIMELFPGVKASCRKRRQGKNTVWHYREWLRSLKAVWPCSPFLGKRQGGVLGSGRLHAAPPGNRSCAIVCLDHVCILALFVLH